MIHRSRSIVLPVVVACLALTSVARAQQQPSWQRPPALVVGIVVDQMRIDYLYRYWNNFGEGGFKRLVREGAFQRDAHYDYAPTHTGPGHASIYSGTTPMHHGIVANDMFVRSTGALLNCVQDDRSTGVGGSGVKGQRSPVNLLSTTLADELERLTDRRAKTIGIAMKDRSAILPIGRTGDAAYWFFEDEGMFGTSSWYRKELPRWVQDFNARGLVHQHLSGTWDLLLPKDRYHQVLPDDNPYEGPLAPNVAPTLPQDLSALSTAVGASKELVLIVPGSNTITTELALAAIVGEELGKDASTDLLAVSYSAPDELGHTMGPRALEMEDMYLRLDLELERFFKALDEQVGKGRYTVFLTADHGAVDVPEYLKDQRASAGYVDITELIAAVDTALTTRFGPGTWVRRRIKEQFFLNDSLITARKLVPADVQRVVADALLAHPAIADALTATDLARWQHTDGVRERVQRGFMPMRSGDVCYVLRPSHLQSLPGIEKKGTDHGSPWNYDTHVPVLMMGQGIQHGEVLRRTSITDIAPTICAVIGMALPDACSGQVVMEVVR